MSCPIGLIHEISVTFILEATIPEIPSPSKEEMDIYNSEYEPAAEIVESFISNDPPENTMAADQHLIPFEGTVSETTGAGENLEGDFFTTIKHCCL